MWPFEAFLVVHITTGAVGLILFWIPTIGKKGSPTHRKFGMLFSRLMMVTASMAIGMASTTLLAPLETHPKQVALNWPQSRIEGIFGWMMLYLAILTIQLVWHGVVTIRNKKHHLANRHWGNVALNVFTIFAALVCAYRGWLIDEGLMMAFSIVGVASGLTNLWFIYTDEPRRIAYQLEHVKAIVGSGISVYTAFMAFGFVRLSPGQALNPRMWAIPLVVGLVIIIYHQARIRIAFMRHRQVSASAKA
ncbi:MAG: hypothetical protein ACK5AK_10350 [Gemmatimonas sp.]|jgi:hypothetical protein